MKLVNKLHSTLSKSKVAVPQKSVVAKPVNKAVKTASSKVKVAGVRKTGVA